MNPHTALLNRTRVAVSRIKNAVVRMFPNQNGHGVTGSRIETITKRKTVDVYPGDIVVRGGRRITYGLGAGSGDLIGYVSIVVTPEHVGKKLAVFVSLEGKTGTGRMEDEQRAWHDALRQAGAISEEVREPQDAVDAVEGAVRGVAG